MSSTVAQKLDDARQELLDLGLRNSLINYRRLKARGIQVVDEVPREIFRIVVMENKNMSFLPAEDDEQDNEQQIQENEQVSSEQGEEEPLAQPEDEENGIAARHIDTKLQTPYTPEL